MTSRRRKPKRKAKRLPKLTFGGLKFDDVMRAVLATDPKKVKKPGK
jgi:hypothetical protein